MTANGNVTNPGTDVEIVGPSVGGSSALDKLNMLKTGSGIVTTMTGTDLDSRKATLNAVTNAEPVADHLDKTINLVHCVFQAVTINDANTGGEVEAVRTILLDADGSAYAAISDGLMGSLRDVFGIMGQPAEWPEPLPVQVQEKRSNAGRRFMTLVLA